MSTNTQSSIVSKLKLPGRTFQLPSRGALYNNGEVLSAEGEVHVHPLSAIAEINLKTPDLLFNGKALEEVFAECVPEVKKPAELFGRDIDALMFFLRLVTYGQHFSISVKHTCDEAKEHQYSVDLEKILQEMKFIDPTTVESNYTCVLPNGQVVKVHPIKFSHMIQLYHMNIGKTELTTEDLKRNIVFNLANVIESIDGTTDRKEIEEWVASAPTPYHNRITEVIEKTNQWGPASSAKLVCKDCGHEMDVDLPLNPVNFFTEGS